MLYRQRLAVHGMQVVKSCYSEQDWQCPEWRLEFAIQRKTSGALNAGGQELLYRERLAVHGMQVVKSCYTEKDYQCAECRWLRVAIQRKTTSVRNAGG